MHSSCSGKSNRCSFDHPWPRLRAFVQVSTYSQHARSTEISTCAVLTALRCHLCTHFEHLPARHLAAAVQAADMPSSHGLHRQTLHDSNWQRTGAYGFKKRVRPSVKPAGLHALFQPRDSSDAASLSCAVSNQSVPASEDAPAVAVVIGAGVTGLMAALQLARFGMEVQVCAGSPCST